MVKKKRAVSSSPTNVARSIYKIPCSKLTKSLESADIKCRFKKVFGTPLLGISNILSILSC